MSRTDLSRLVGQVRSHLDLIAGHRARVAPRRYGDCPRVARSSCGQGSQLGLPAGLGSVLDELLVMLMEHVDVGRRTRLGWPPNGGGGAGQCWAMAVSRSARAWRADRRLRPSTGDADPGAVVGWTAEPWSCWWRCWRACWRGRGSVGVGIAGSGRADYHGGPVGAELGFELVDAGVTPGVGFLEPLGMVGGRLETWSGGGALGELAGG